MRLQVVLSRQGGTTPVERAQVVGGKLVGGTALQLGRGMGRKLLKLAQEQVRSWQLLERFFRSGLRRKQMVR